MRPPRTPYAPPHLLAFPAVIYLQVRGYGLSGDGHHITAPHPAGVGAALAMRRALQGSGVPASSICYINAHATSTPVGDEIEQAAILDVFGQDQVGGCACAGSWSIFCTCLYL
jgi:3-oxoacyl-[acyl-carrier-protein] synthase II